MTDLTTAVTYSGTERVSRERDLLEAVAAGDRVAFAALYDMHASSVYAFAASGLPTRSDAEDVSQETWLTLWRKRASVVVYGESVLPWLLTTCKNHRQNRLRTLQTAARRTREHDLEREPARTSGPERLAEQRELGDAVDAAVSRLGDIDPAIFEHCVVNERSYDDVAEALGVRAGTVRNRLSRLRIRLRSELQTLKGTS